MYLIIYWTHWGLFPIVLLRHTRTVEIKKDTLLWALRTNCTKKISSPHMQFQNHGTPYKYRGSRPEWCISSMIYSRDTPFWSGTLEYIMMVSSTVNKEWRGGGGGGRGGREEEEEEEEKKKRRRKFMNLTPGFLQTLTLAPCCKRMLVKPLPSPWAPPVTSAALPSIFILLSCHGALCCCSTK